MTLLATAAVAPDGAPTWAEVLSVFLMPLLCLLAVYRFRTGWGARGAELRAQGTPWAVFIARFGYAFMPFTWGGLAAALGAVSVRMVHETGLDIFGFVGLLLLLCWPGCMVWGIKEYRRPSRWRRRPQWLAEFEQARPRL